MEINVETLMQWEAVIAQASLLGVKSWRVIKALLDDAGADDALIAALEPKWDALIADIARAAEPPADQNI